MFPIIRAINWLHNCKGEKAVDGGHRIYYTLISDYRGRVCCQYKKGEKQLKQVELTQYILRLYFYVLDDDDIHPFLTFIPYFLVELSIFEPDPCTI